MASEHPFGVPRVQDDEKEAIRDGQHRRLLPSLDALQKWQQENLLGTEGQNLVRSSRGEERKETNRGDPRGNQRKNFENRMQQLEQEQKRLTKIDDAISGVFRDQQLKRTRDWTDDHLKLLYLVSLYTMRYEDVVAHQYVKSDDILGAKLNTKHTVMQEQWIRLNSLLVLIYECIVGRVFDYDYAPFMQMLGDGQLLFINTTQEGRNHLEELVEGDMMHVLRLATRNYQTIVAYQLTEKGSRTVEAMDARLKLVVDAFVYHIPLPNQPGYELYLTLPPHRNLPENMDAAGDRALGRDGEVKQPNQPTMPGEAISIEDINPDEMPFGWDDLKHRFARLRPHPWLLFDVAWSGECFLLFTPAGFIKKSSVTDIENVSYVCSPYIPLCCRADPGSGQVEKLKSNLQQAKRCVKLLAQSHGIRDELDELLFLDNVTLMMGEWLPFGHNQLVSLVNRLGAAERIKGGMFVSVVDEDPNSTRFVHEVTPIGTAVKVLDYSGDQHINFSANFFEDMDGIVQVEEFGVHIHSTGAVMYSLTLESILHNLRKNISLDLLSRILPDINRDSCLVTSNLLSSFQQHLLRVVYGTHALSQRPKSVAIMATAIDPSMEVDDFLDKGDYETELRQIIGDVRLGVQLAEKEMIFFGKHGLIVVGARVHRHEDMIVEYLRLRSRAVFVDGFFRRVFFISDKLSRLDHLIDNMDSHPETIVNLQQLQAQTKQELIVLDEVRSYLQESLDQCAPVKPDLNDEGSVNLARELQCSQLLNTMKARSIDLQKNIASSRSLLTVTIDKINLILEREKYARMVNVDENTRKIDAVESAVDRSSRLMNVVLLTLTGLLGLQLWDRITTFHLSPFNNDGSDWASYQEYIVDYLLSYPGAYLGAALVVWLICALLFRYLGNRSIRKTMGNLRVRFVPNRRVRTHMLSAYLIRQDVINWDVDSGTTKSKCVKVVRWRMTDRRLVTHQAGCCKRFFRWICCCCVASDARVIRSWQEDRVVQEQSRIDEAKERNKKLDRALEGKLGSSEGGPAIGLDGSALRHSSDKVQRVSTDVASLLGSKPKADGLLATEDFSQLTESREKRKKKHRAGGAKDLSEFVRRQELEQSSGRSQVDHSDEVPAAVINLWQKCPPPLCEMTIDTSSGFLLKCVMLIDNRLGAWTSQMVEGAFHKELAAWGVWRGAED